MDHCVFIHTNHKQALGARVAAYALKRNSHNADRFDVRIIHTENYPWLQHHDGKKYLRDGLQRLWLYDDLQSFTPLRFLPPELMDFQGRAVIMDPDIFAVGDIWELLTQDMAGKAIVCRLRAKKTKDKHKTDPNQCKASSVMLLDCALLKHWDAKRYFKSMFAGALDYHNLICLKTESVETIGYFAHAWNDFDRLTGATKLLHNTKRLTQPWKAGLPIDWRPAERFRMFPPIGWAFRLKRALFGEYAFLGRYRTHPDKNQERFFFGLLKECLEQGVVTQTELEQEMASNYLRHDALEILRATKALNPWPEFPLPNMNRADTPASAAY